MPIDPTILLLIRENDTTLTSLDLSSKDFNSSGNRITLNCLSQLADALEDNTKLKSLNLSGNKLGMEAAKEIARIIHHASLLSLNVASMGLRRVFYTEDYLDEVNEALGENTKLKELIIGSNEISDALLEGLSINRAIEALDLSYTQHLTAEKVASLLKNNSTLKHLNLSGNYHISVGVFDGLAQNSTVETLKMRECSAGFSEALIDCLNTNTTLKKIDFGGKTHLHGIYHTSHPPLMPALRNNFSLISFLGIVDGGAEMSQIFERNITLTNSISHLLKIDPLSITIDDVKTILPVVERIFFASQSRKNSYIQQCWNLMQGLSCFVTQRYSEALLYFFQNYSHKPFYTILSSVCAQSLFLNGSFDSSDDMSRYQLIAFYTRNNKEDPLHKYALLKIANPEKTSALRDITDFKYEYFTDTQQLLTREEIMTLVNTARLTLLKKKREKEGSWTSLCKHHDDFKKTMSDFMWNPNTRKEWLQESEDTGVITDTLLATLKSSVNNYINHHMDIEELKLLKLFINNPRFRPEVVSLLIRSPLFVEALKLHGLEASSFSLMEDYIQNPKKQIVFDYSTEEKTHRINAQDVTQYEYFVTQTDLFNEFITILHDQLVYSNIRRYPEESQKIKAIIDEIKTKPRADRVNAFFGVYDVQDTSNLRIINGLNNLLLFLTYLPPQSSIEHIKRMLPGITQGSLGSRIDGIFDDLLFSTLTPLLN